MSKERKKLVKKLDTAFSLYIRTRDKFICQTCGKTRPEVIIQCGHLFSRQSYSTRWDERNAFAQCASCNFYHEADFEPLRQAFLRKYDQDIYDSVYRAYRQTKKFIDADLVGFIDYFKEKTAMLEADNLFI